MKHARFGMRIEEAVTDPSKVPPCMPTCLFRQPLGCSALLTSLTQSLPWITVGQANSLVSVAIFADASA